MTARFRYLQAIIRSRGLWGAAYYACYSYFRVNRFCVLCYKPASIAELPRPSWLVVRPASLEELRTIRQSLDPAPYEFHCDDSFGFSSPFLAFVDGEIAGIDWIVRRGEYSRFLTLGSRDAEMNYNLVLPRFRGRRIALELKREMLRYLNKEGVMRVFCVVHTSNAPQMRTLLNLGFQPVQQLLHIGFYRPKARRHDDVVGEANTVFTPH